MASRQRAVRLVGGHRFWPWPDQHGLVAGVLMRWLLAIIAAAAVSSIAYSLGLGPELAYILRSIARHLVNSAGVLVGPLWP